MSRVCVPECAVYERCSAENDGRRLHYDSGNGCCGNLEQQNEVFWATTDSAACFMLTCGSTVA